MGWDGVRHAIAASFKQRVTGSIPVRLIKTDAHLHTSRGDHELTTPAKCHRSAPPPRVRRIGCGDIEQTHGARRELRSRRHAVIATTAPYSTATIADTGPRDA